MLCSGSFVAVRRIFISWGIRPALYKTDIVTVSDVMLYLILKFLKLVGYTTLTSCSTVLLPFHHSAMETLYFKKKKPYSCSLYSRLQLLTMIFLDTEQGRVSGHE